MLLQAYVYKQIEGLYYCVRLKVIHHSGVAMFVVGWVCYPGDVVEDDGPLWLCLSASIKAYDWSIESFCFENFPLRPFSVAIVLGANHEHRPALNLFSNFFDPKSRLIAGHG